MYDRWAVNQPLTIPATFEVDHVLTDPTTVSLVLEAPNGSTEVTSTWPPPGVIQRVSIGSFEATVTPATLGIYSWRISSTGTAAGVLEGQFEVVSIITDTLAIIRTGEDYEAVRQVLGVTAIDVDDPTIRALPFGQMAELRVKERWPTWAVDRTDPLLGPQLRMATVYLAAALIASQWAQGGMIGFIRPLDRSGASRDWSATANQMRAMYESAIGDLEGGTTVAPEFDLVGQVVYGPSYVGSGSRWWLERPVHRIEWEG